MVKLLINREGKAYGWVHFKYAEEITEDQAMKMQMDSGFHPSGYGFYSYKAKDGVTSWSCSNCCD